MFLNKAPGHISTRLRLEAEFQQVDIHEGLESMLLLRKNDLRDKIKVTKTFGEIPPVACYPSELNQAFMNILSNAIEAIDDTGEIKIQTAINGSNVRIVFSDTGRGILRLSCVMI